MEVEISKRYSSYSYGCFSGKLFLNVPCDYPHNTYFLEFWNFKLKFKKKDWNLTLCQMGKCKIADILQMASRRAKRSEIWDSGGTSRSICATLALWPMAKFHAHIWQFWKWACISETAACRGNISSILTPCGRKTVYVHLLELWPLANFHGQIFHLNFCNCL